jgi:DNA-binding MarR family transcriptional regulator
MNASVCFCSSLRKAARIITALYDGALSPTGLTAAQFQLLRILCRIDRPTISGIAEVTGLDRSTLGRNVRVLERGGLVRLALGMDERTHIIDISDEGRQRMEIAVPLWEAVQERVSTRFDGKIRDQALELLGILKAID